MSFRKPCHMPFSKLIPPFTLTADVLVLMFWLGALEFKILKFLFSCCHYIFLGNFPRFSVHKSLKILEKYIANFLKG